LSDHCLLLHPEQTARIENKLPACTVGSLEAGVRVDSLIDLIQDLPASENSKKMLSQLEPESKRAPSTAAVQKTHGRKEPWRARALSLLEIQSQKSCVVLGEKGEIVRP
jgi:hypothetical protein